MSHYITLKAGKERKKHYENFPVATLLYPKKIREAVIIFYQFARIGDDIADEGIFSKKQLKSLLRLLLYRGAVGKDIGYMVVNWQNIQRYTQRLEQAQTQYL